MARLWNRRTRAFLLVMPMALFIAVFFVWPLVIMVKQSVSDTAVLQILPRTADEVAGWDRASPPSEAMQAALIADLRAATDEKAVGDMVRRLNSAQSGFRTLMSKTISAVAKPETGPLLAPVDKRWMQPPYWIAIADALEPRTDRYLLAAVDLERDATGDITQMPEGSSANRLIFGRTFWIAGLVTLFCVLIGYPYALLIAASTGTTRAILLAAVLLPLWTSLLVRTAAWFILLQEQGLINGFLLSTGVIASPLALIFNRTGVVIAMTHVLLPLMVLPIYSVLVTIPTNLMPAATSLGAHPLRAFVHVMLPLSLRGVVSGMLLVFMTAVGYYITPALVGGAGDQMISAIIAFYSTQTANWSMASALGMVLLAITLVLYVVYAQLSGRNSIGGRM
ncbi:ABC transporter permease [Ancylobacter sp. A5.8]|nr:ABC transporter permease [Ancylobacter gelatini]MCJ8145303.1 ABC transporter permease [Ancylobacter gelatini]